MMDIRKLRVPRRRTGMARAWNTRPVMRLLYNCGLEWKTFKLTMDY